MLRRSLVFITLALSLLVLSASPALAYETLWSEPVLPGAALAAGSGSAGLVWPVDAGGVGSIEAQGWTRAGASFLPQTIAGGFPTPIAGPLAAADGSRNVTAVYKWGGTVYASRVTLGGSTAYAPLAIYTDAAVTALRGAASTVTPVKVVADNGGAVYVVLQISPSSSDPSKYGDTLLVYIAPDGGLTQGDPNQLLKSGTVLDLSVDAEGHAFVLLGAPGRTTLAVQRYGPDLTADWDKPVSPYNPLLGSMPSSAEAIGVTAESNAIFAWREGAKVKVQRLSPGGSRLWLRPVSVAQTGEVHLTSDGRGGCYIVGVGADGVVAHHVLFKGTEMGGPSGYSLAKGLSAPRIDAVASDRAGDLAVAYSNGGVSPTGLARMTFIGGWSDAALATAPTAVAALAADHSGGTYMLDTGAGVLAHIAEPGLVLTMRPQAASVKFPAALRVSGYLTDAGEPVTGATVALQQARTGARTAAGPTDEHGYYEASVSPRANCTLSANGGGATSDGMFIGVNPKVTLNLSHLRGTSRLVEIFTGSVRPGHAGAKVKVQRKKGTSWVTVAADKLDSRSRYRAQWVLPRKSATYKLRVILPAHADHLVGTSTIATLRVRVRG